jgi:hypothetical protein
MQHNDKLIINYTNDTYTYIYRCVTRKLDIRIFFFLNVSRRAAKFIDKRENGQETHTAQFVGKPGETLNNGNATPKAPQHIQDVGKRNTRNA